MRHVENAFFILGIEVTQNKRAIKKAYAEKVKEYHPEEQPELWERVRNAYKEALDYADGKTLYEDENVFPFEEEQRVDQSEQEQTFYENQEEDYRKAFVDAQRQDVDEYQSMLRQTLDTLLRLSRIPGIQYQADWVQLLGSEHFNKTWDDDLVLQALMTTLSQVRFTADTARLVMNRLDAMRQRFISSMQSYKGKMAEDMMNIVGMRNVMPQGNIMAPVQKKKSPVWIWCLGCVAAVVIMVLVGVMFARESSGMSQANAAELINEYLENKYPDLTIEGDPSDMSEIKEFDDRMSESVAWGYEMRLDAPKEGVAKVFVWETKDGELMTSCFDNLQAKEIEADVKEKMQEITGREEIEIALSGYGDGAMRGFKGEAGSIYQERYESDMEAFFEKEAGT